LASSREQAAATAPATPPASAKRGLPDADLERAIRARFARSKISTNGFTVRVQNGIAILEGQTGVIQHKGTATRLAKSAGAKAVQNKIQISEQARQKAAANLAKGRKHITVKPATRQTKESAGSDSNYRALRRR
jgi:osmotically-inducible protein OsmY